MGVCGFSAARSFPGFSRGMRVGRRREEGCRRWDRRGPPTGFFGGEGLKKGAVILGEREVREHG